MKTTSYGTIKLIQQGGGEVTLKVSAPGQGTVNLGMTPDEVFMLMIELGQDLSSARKLELAERVKRNLEKETRR